MARLRFRSRATIERASPNPAGDGAGNFQDGWDTYLGPVSCNIVPRLARENQQDGQEASRQQFYIDVRATPVSQRIDSRDRVREHGPAGRTFNVVANGWRPGLELVRLTCEETPVVSVSPGQVPGAEVEPPPVFTPGP